MIQNENQSLGMMLKISKFRLYLQNHDHKNISYTNSVQIKLVKS